MKQQTLSTQYSVLSIQYCDAPFKFAQSDKIYSPNVVKGSKGKIALGSIGIKGIWFKVKAKKNIKV